MAKKSKRVLYGEQTKKSLQNFSIGPTMPKEFIYNLIIFKSLAAKVNGELKNISIKKSLNIQKSAKKLLKSDFMKNFPLVVYQTGSGTQTNMNTNEVLATLAKVHPNDDVNFGQSSNDVIPTVISVTLSQAIEDKLKPEVKKLILEIKNFTKKYGKVVKVGRTHLMDATPIGLKQEFSAYEYQLNKAWDLLEQAQKEINNLAVGATAVGTGINTHPKFGGQMAKELSKKFKLKFKSHPNKFSAISNHKEFLFLAFSLKNLAVILTKFSEDIRFLASGPRAGISELIFPANEAGSSIMPGKVNPTQIEALLMVCAKVIGMETTITQACLGSQLQLNTFKPLILDQTLDSIKLLSESINSFNLKCFKGLKPNLKNIDNNLQKSLMIATLLNPILGYEKVSYLTKKALEDNLTLKEIILKEKILTEKEFNKIINYKTLIGEKNGDKS